MATPFTFSETCAESSPLFSTADNHEHNPAGDGERAKEWRKRDGVRFGVTDLERPEVTPREAGLADAEFLPLASLPAIRGEFETWSQFCIDALLLRDGRPD